MDEVCDRWRHLRSEHPAVLAGKIAEINMSDRTLKVGLELSSFSVLLPVDLRLCVRYSSCKWHIDLTVQKTRIQLNKEDVAVDACGASYTVAKV